MLLLICFKCTVLNMSKEQFRHHCKILCFFSLCGICRVFTANKSVVVEEMLHNLDFCDVLVSGAELDPEQECLELDRTELQGKHLDATNSTAGYSIYGMFLDAAFPYFFPPTVTFSE